MHSVLNRVSLAVRGGVLGLIAGVLSCEISQSHLIYWVREQKTLDHIVWPGFVFALVVLLPLSRWAGDGWRRTVAALAGSSAIYPLTWQIATLGLHRSANFTLAAFAFSGLLGASVLATVFLAGRPRWLRAAGATVVLGTVIGGLMGAHLGLALTLVSGRDGLGLLMVAWQAAVGYALGRGLLASPNAMVSAGDTSRNSDGAHLDAQG